MSGAINVGSAFGRMRRRVHSGVDDTDLVPDVQIITPLDVFLRKHRPCKSLIPLSFLPPKCRKDFYDKVVDYYIQKGGETLAYFSAAESVAHQFGLAIAACDRRT